MKTLLFHFQAALIAGLLPPRLSASLGDGNGQLHYRPLNGRDLREISRRKEHHGNGRFINPLGLPRESRYWQLLSWKLSQNPFQDALKGQPETVVNADWERIHRHQGVSVTFLKHASVLIRDADKTLIVDPVFSDIFWFIRDFSPLGFPIQELPRPDHVLITHGHYDHLDEASLTVLGRDTHVISPLGHDRVFADLQMNRRTKLDWYDPFVDGDRTITLLPANHWTMRSPLRGPNRSLWGGYMVQTAGGPTIYVSGDTAYFDGFDQLGADYDIDLAIINLGAYEPRWFMAQSHLNPKETVQAFKELGAKRLMIAHWGTFRLGDEPVHFPPEDLRKELEKEGLLDRLVDLRHGETIFLA